jgi:hypothetical protein
MSGWASPNGPVQPDGPPQQTYGQSPPPLGHPGFQQPGYYPQAGYPPPPPRNGIRPLLIIAGVVAVVLIAAALVVIAVLREGDSGGSSSDNYGDRGSYTVSAPDTAGGYLKTSDMTGSLMTEFSSVATEEFGAGTKAVGATYMVDGREVTFVAVSRGSKKQANINSKVKAFGFLAPMRPTDAGGAGTAACSVIRTRKSGEWLSFPMCAWLTDSTMGMLVGLPGPDHKSKKNWSELADAMRKMRPEVEHIA